MNGELRKVRRASRHEVKFVELYVLIDLVVLCKQ